MKAEKVNQTAQRLGYSSFLLGLIRILHLHPKQSKITPQSKTEALPSKHSAITGEDLEYTHSEQIPSREYYSAKEAAKREAKKQDKRPRVYGGPDLRGG